MSEFAKLIEEARAVAEDLHRSGDVAGARVVRSLIASRIASAETNSRLWSDNRALRRQLDQAEDNA